MNRFTFPHITCRAGWLLAVNLFLGLAAGLFSFLVLGPGVALGSRKLESLGVEVTYFWNAHCAYPLYLLALAWACFVFFRERPLSAWKSWAAGSRWLFLGILGGAVFLQLGEFWDYRVYFDEPSHAGAARLLHMGKKFEGIASWHQPFEVGEVCNTILPMRMGLFPFLLSLVHDLAGYRESNIFVLNALISAAFLLVLALLGNRLGGRAGAWSALLGAVSLPLLCQVVNSGSYDQLFLLLLAALLLQALRVEESPTPLRQAQLLALALLLMLCRYEGSVYLVVTAVFVLRAWMRSHRVWLPWGSLMFPAAVLTVGIVRDRFMEVNKNLVSDMRGSDAGLFSLSHVADNVRGTLGYLFLPDRLGTGSALLCWLGLTSVLALLAARFLPRRPPFSRPHLALPVLFFTVFTVLLWCAVFLPTFWSVPTDPVSSRFTLPLFLVAIIAVAVAAGNLVRWNRLTAGIALGLAGVHLLGWTLPSMFAHRATLDMKTALAQAEWRRFADEHPGKGRLFAGESNLPLSLSNRSATLTVAINHAPDKIRRIFGLGIYQELYCLEMFWAEAPDKGRNYGVSPRLAKEWERTHVLFKEIAPKAWIEISRVTGYTPADGSPAWKLEVTDEKPPSFDEVENWNHYVTGFILSEI